MPIPAHLSELDAATAYASAWNSLDCSGFVKLLAPDARYVSQYVFAELSGREAVAAYLSEKMAAVKGSGQTVYAELTKATLIYPGRFCVALAQGDKQVVAAVVVFEVDANHIRRFDLCIPDLYRVSRTGLYPGLLGEK